MSRWSSDEDRILRQLAAAGCHAHDIAEALPDRTYNAVLKHARLLGIQIAAHPAANERRRGSGSKPVFTGKRQPRNCMTCGKIFGSEGSHHRMCNDCRHKSMPTGWEMVV